MLYYKFDLRYVDEATFDYDENINYQFVDDKEFNKICENTIETPEDDFSNPEYKDNHNLVF